MGPLELYIIISQTLALLLACLFYFGITPHTIQTIIVKFVRFIRFHPQIIAVLFLIVIVNLGIISFKSVGYVRILGVVSGFLAILGLASAFGKYSTKTVPSTQTQLLVVMASRFHSISDLRDGAKIVTSTYGSSPQWMQTALDSYGISFNPIFVPTNELFLALKVGVVDAVLITNHPLDIMKTSIESGEIRLLPWSKPALEAVTRAFPTGARPAVLPPNTYEGQSEGIQGYAPY